MLRHPYGKKRDLSRVLRSRSSCTTPACAACGGATLRCSRRACSACAAGGPTIDDLPCHYFVDDRGDTIALPCPDRLTNTEAAATLRDQGINGVVAHNGEPAVRLSGIGVLMAEQISRGRPRLSR
jgi:type VI secretion system protein ImpC